MGHTVVQISISLPPSQTPVYITKPQIHSVPFSVAVAGSHCAYLYRDGQAELTSMAGYLRWSFIHPQSYPTQY